MYNYHYKINPTENYELERIDYINFKERGNY